MELLTQQASATCRTSCCLRWRVPRPGRGGPSARSDGRPAHAFCDLTADPFRPVWLPIEAVGGRARGVDPEAFSSSLTGSSGSSQLEVALTRALKQAYLAGGGRFFRTLQQWSLCYQRYMFAAVATGHSTWPQLFAHMASVYRLAEASANAQQGVYLAILYDEVARREWSARAARGDNTLDILKESHSPPTDLVAAAQSRLQTVLSSAGLQQEPTASPVGHTAGDFTLSSQLSQQEAAANALLRRSQDASRAMVAEADRLRAREEALRAGEDTRTDRGRHKGDGYKGGAHRGGKGGGAGKGKGDGPPLLSNRKKKAADFFRKHGRGGKRGGR